MASCSGFPAHQVYRSWPISSSLIQIISSSSRRRLKTSSCCRCSSDCLLQCAWSSNVFPSPIKPYSIFHTPKQMLGDHAQDNDQEGGDDVGCVEIRCPNAFAIGRWPMGKDMSVLLSRELCCIGERSSGDSLPIPTDDLSQLSWHSLWTTYT